VTFGRSIQGLSGKICFRLLLIGLFITIFIGVPTVAQDTATAPALGFPTDWSSSHLVFTDGGTPEAQRKARQDPRAQMQWMRENLPLVRRGLPPIGRPRPHAPRRDWNFSLQTAAANSGVTPTRYPAKYTFAPNGPADCAADFVIYGLNVTGSATQANLIGINNLYVGTTGLCSTIDNGGGSGAVPTPNVQWAYFDAAGPITSSIVLNLTGTKVAYVANSSPATVRVLTLGPSTGAVTAATDVTTATLASVTLSSTVSNSSIFVDYANDIGWVGDDNGNLYKITTIFTGTPTLDSTLTPDLNNCRHNNDNITTAPVYDGGTDTVFVACQGGFLYGYTTASGTPVPMANPVQLAASNPGIIAPPIVDSTNHVLYAFYAEDVNTKEQEMAQMVYTATPTFSSAATADLSTAGTNRVTLTTQNNNTNFAADGAFSHSYFSGFSAATSFLYACGPNSAGKPTGIALLQLSFNDSRILSGAAANVATLDSTLNVNNAAACSPMTHYFNTNTATDYLFFSIPPLATNNVLAFDITNNTAGGALSPASTATVAGGASGMIVDGADPSDQASSLYFTSLSAGADGCSISTGSPAGNVANPSNNGIGSVATAVCAYKLTQAGLQ
jgi:hypothetical protein